MKTEHHWHFLIGNYPEFAYLSKADKEAGIESFFAKCPRAKAYYNLSSLNWLVFPLSLCTWKYFSGSLSLDEFLFTGLAVSLVFACLRPILLKGAIRKLFDQYIESSPTSNDGAKAGNNNTSEDIRPEWQDDLTSWKATRPFYKFAAIFLAVFFILLFASLFFMGH